MKSRNTAAPVAAALAAVATLACCLPLGLAGAAGLAGLAVVLEGFRPWLLSAAVAFLLLGFYQLRRGVSECRRASRFHVAVLSLSAAIVVAVLLFPQFVAEVLAGRSDPQPGASAIEPANVAAFRDEFNAASDRPRIVVLLSPT